MTDALTAVPSPHAIEVAAVPAARIMDRLREETAGHHRQAESCAFQRSLAKGQIEPPVLSAWFGQMMHVHRALERALRAARAPARPWSALFQEDQSREGDLIADMSALLGRDGQPAVAPLPPTAAFVGDVERLASAADPCALLGVLYVLEGSNNGSKFIARALQRAWNWPPERRLRYLDPYGDRQRERWQRFKDEMNALSFSPRQEGAIVDAAKGAFGAIHAMSVAMLAGDSQDACA